MFLQLTQAVGAIDKEAPSGQSDEFSDRGFDSRLGSADRGHHGRAFVQGCRYRVIIPHDGPMPDGTAPSLEHRTLRTATCRISQVIRRRIEEILC